MDSPGTRRRDPTQPKGRQVDDAALAEVAATLGDLPRRRDLLIEALHLIQDAHRCLSAPHLAALAELFRLSQAEVYEVATFYHHFDVVKEGQPAPPPVTIRVCESLSCAMAGAARLIRDLSEKVDPARVRVQPVPCIGACDRAPAAQVGKRAIGHATVAALALSATGDTTPDIPEYESLAVYRSTGGYTILTRIRSGEISAESAIATLSDGGLRGLGGAGFPAGRKWGIVKGFDGPRLMTINGDEGEPGTFKDRWWLERQPHRMLEGALIAAHVVGCARIYLYLRDEYPAVLQILKTEIAALAAAGLLSTPIEVRRGAGAYVCGEESAMIESIEGKRGLPRHRPPYIAQTGLFGRPTLNHNIETLSWVPDILRNGADWFAARGWSAAHKGLRSYSVSGRVRAPGVKLAPAGIPVNRLIEEFCGGMAEGHVFKAFLPGGASGGILPASMADMPLDFGSFEKVGGFIGSHAVVILSDHDSIRDAALNLTRFFAHESCGQCTPCRVGTEKMALLLQAPDRPLMEDLLTVMRDSSICGLGQAAGNPVAHLLRYFPEELA
jgi:NADH:ubiquinone oxidoreductase subunit F (NADH-binding)/NADH:ubiquinone oxidoreductase subunit E